jgi:3-oxoadipate enol-lactonase
MREILNGITVERLRLHDHETEIAIAGDGAQNALLLHAVGLDWRMWKDVLAVFPRGVRVIACDLRGHGAAATAQPTTLEQHVADVCEILDLLGLERAHVAGLSYGGAVAQMVGILRPERVLSLGLLATFSRAPREVLLARAADAEQCGIAAAIPGTMTRWFIPAEIEAQIEGVRYVRERLQADRVENWAAAWRALSEMDAVGKLSGVAAPATVIAGELDPTTPPAALRAIADELPNAELHVLPGCSHMLTLERPQVIAELLAQGFTRA